MARGKEGRGGEEEKRDKKKSASKSTKNNMEDGAATEGSRDPVACVLPLPRVWLLNSEHLPLISRLPVPAAIQPNRSSLFSLLLTDLYSSAAGCRSKKLARLLNRSSFRSFVHHFHQNIKLNSIHNPTYCIIPEGLRTAAIIVLISL